VNAVQVLDEISEPLAKALVGGLGDEAPLHAGGPAQKPALSDPLNTLRGPR
jgi:hypothetical protein